MGVLRVRFVRPKRFCDSPFGAVNVEVQTRARKKPNSSRPDRSALVRRDSVRPVSPECAVARVGGLLPWRAIDGDATW
jgi:hypothetical protein